MAIGKSMPSQLRGSAATDPIVRAIALAEASTTGEIRVHLSRQLLEKDPYAHALWLFDRFGMSRTRQRNAVLIYVNLRRHRFAIVGDEGVSHAVGAQYWKQLGAQLSDDLRSTDPERAIALAVAALGEKLKLHFPEEA